MKMEYEYYDREGLDIPSHCVYTNNADTDEDEMRAFLERNGVDLTKIQYIEFEPIPGRHIWHEKNIR